MKQNIIRCILLLFIVSIITGCSKSQIKPDLQQYNSNQKYQIDSFSYKVNTPYKKLNNKRDLAFKIFDKTQTILANSIPKDTLPDPTFKYEKDTFHLHATVTYRGHGGACGQEYLTGFSLGLIPSWCTREKLYQIQFTLYKVTPLRLNLHFSRSHRMMSSSIGV